MRQIVVVNPMSRGGALGRQWPDISGLIRRRIGSFEEVFTEAAGDATRLAREAVTDGFERVIAIGGDGTIGEVANGFFVDGEPISDTAALGVLPFGSGGDFRKSIRVPKDLDAAAVRLAEGSPKKIDVGLLDYTTMTGESASRVFINIASFGISGLVDQYVNDSSKVLGGTLSFALATVRAGLSYDNRRVRLEFDDDPESVVEPIIQTVAVANGRYFGGGMCIAPEAELDDGMFDIVCLGDFRLRDMVLSGSRLYNGTHLSLDKVSHRRARTVTATPVDGSDVLLDVDGETPGRLPARFRILPKSLSIVVP